MVNMLAAYRKSRNLSQKEFAQKLGIGTTTLCKWENPSFDLKELKVTTIELICEILHTTKEELL